MNNEEIESLLHRARPPELPAGLKRRVLQAARQNAVPAARVSGMAWGALAACWAVIILLRTTTPDVPSGNLPFDREAFLARAAAIECFVATGQLPEESQDSPVIQRLRIEAIFRLPKAAPGACLPKILPQQFI